MDTLLALAKWLMPLVYLALAIDYGATFILRTRTHARNPGVTVAIVLHVAYLIILGVNRGRAPVDTVAEVLSLVALSSAVVYWAIEMFTHDRRAGVFVFLLIFLCQYTASTLLGAAPVENHPGQRWLHIVPACLAYTAMGFAALYAGLYLVGQRNLKQHSVGLLFDRLPPLELLGTMCWHALLVGLVFMTVAMVTGAMTYSHGASGQALKTKVIVRIVISSIAWLTCGTGVLGRWLAKWSLVRVAVIAVIGFVVVVAYLVTSIMMS